MNVVCVIGRLTAEPELKKTANDVSVVSFTLAVGRDYVKTGEERVADFLDCVAWRQQADFISKYFHKGSQIAIQGTVQTRNWEDKNGAKRKSTEVIVTQAGFTGNKEKSEDIKDLPEISLPF